MATNPVRRRLRRRMLAVGAAMAVVGGVAVTVPAVSAHTDGANAAGQSTAPRDRPRPMAAPQETAVTRESPVSQASAPPLPTGVPGDWRLTLDDEFDGDTLSPVWCSGWFGSDSSGPVNATEVGPYLADNVTVSGGELHLREDGHNGALVSTNPQDGCHGSNPGFQFTYGLVEFRAWLPAGPQGIANWPALWLNGQSWPSDGEIDVMEGLSGSPGVYYHYGTAGDWHPDNGTHVPGTWTGAWHTFAVDRQPDAITFYYDGKQVWRTTENIIGTPMYLIMNDTVNSGDPMTPSTLRVDYVRVWE